MKHLKSFNENTEFVEPIDVESDIVEFREKFLTNNTRKLQPKEEFTLERVNKKLNELETQYITMTDKYELFQITNVTDPTKSMVVVKAVSAAHAYIKASIALNDPSVVFHRLGKNNNQYWKLSTVTPESIKYQIDECELKISKLKDIK